MTQEQKNVSIPGVTVNTSISTFPAPVGIGASDPQSVLHIVSQSPVVKVEDTASGSTATPTIQFLASDGTMGFVGYTGAYYGATGMHLLNVKSTPIFISTNNLERVRITASGNMGIGMTAPTTTLGVSGSGSFSGIVSANGISAVGATFAGNISVGGVMVGRGTGTATDSVAVGQNALQLQTGSMNTAVGSNALANAVNISGNVAVGMDSLRYMISGSNNTAIGLYSQGLVAMTSAQQPSNNTSVGYASLALNQSGQYNVGLGAQAGQACTAGSQNTSVGYQALLNNWASNNIAVGFQALYGNTGGAQNIAIGVQALYANAANYNLAIGYQALNANDKGTNNVAVGHFALLGNTNGGSNTAIGHAAMQFNKSGSANTAIGDHALYSNDIGVNNTALGVNTLYSLTSGSFNVAIGNAALYNNTASNNTAIGEGSLYKNKTGGSNTSVGKDSLTQNISGNNNSAFGVNALGGNSGGSENTAIGTNAMLANISGIANTSVGMQTLAGNSGGNYNTGIGRSALGNNYDSSNNTAIGYAALHGNTAGGDSTAVGYQAGYLPAILGTIVRGVFIGANSVGANPASSTDEIVIGAGATGIGNNTAVIGKSTQTAATIYGVVTASMGVTAPRMFTASLTASVLHVTGVSTLAGVAAASLNVSGGVTAASSLSVVGVSTLAGVSAQSLFVQNGLTAAGSLGVVGNITVGQSIGQLKGGMTQISNMSFISNGDYPTFNRIVVGTDGTGYKFAISSATSSSSIIDHLTINTANGNVGIGITTPAYALDVTGTIRASANLIVSGTANVTGVATLVGVTADSIFVKGGVTAGTVSATTFYGTLNGNASSATLASTVTTNANLTGDVTSSGNTTAIATGVIVDADINASATIADSKLATIATTGKVSNSATTATSAANANTIVLRDPSGGFLAAGITATAINVSSYQLASTGFNNQTVTAYTILATDNGKIITGSNASATTFTLPAATVGYSVTIIQIGTGAITIKPNGTDTLNSFGKTSTTGLTTGGQWAAVDVVCTDSAKWVLFGNLA